MFWWRLSHCLYTAFSHSVFLCYLFKYPLRHSSSCWKFSSAHGAPLLPLSHNLSSSWPSWSLLLSYIFLTGCDQWLHANYVVCNRHCYGSPGRTSVNDPVSSVSDRSCIIILVRPFQTGTPITVIWASTMSPILNITGSTFLNLIEMCQNNMTLFVYSKTHFITSSGDFRCAE